MIHWGLNALKWCYNTAVEAIMRLRWWLLMRWALVERFLKTGSVFGRKISFRIHPWFLKTGGVLKRTTYSEIHDYGVSLFWRKISFRIHSWFLKTGGVFASGIQGPKSHKTAKVGSKRFFFRNGWNHFNCDALKRPEIPRVCCTAKSIEHHWLRSEFSLR